MTNGNIEKGREIIKVIQFQNRLMYSKINYLLISQSFFLAGNLIAYSQVSPILAIIIAIISLFIVFIFALNIWRTRGYMDYYDNELQKVRKKLSNEEKRKFVDFPMPNEKDRAQFTGKKRFRADWSNDIIIYTFLSMWIIIIISEILLMSWGWICNNLCA